MTIQEEEKMSHVKQVLKSCPVFATLTDSELLQMANLTAEKEYEAGVLIFNEKDTAAELLVIEEGKIALQITMPVCSGGTRRKITIDIVAKEGAVGWSAIVEPYVYNFAAICLQKTRVLALNGTRLRILLRENVEIGYRLLSELMKVSASQLDDTRRVLVSERVGVG